MKRSRSFWGNLEAITAIIINTLLFFIKLWAGIRSNSVAIIADSWHTLSDSFSSVIILAALKLSRKPPDRNHPYGHGRAEIISSVIVGTLLVFIGFNFIIDSIQRFRNHQAADFNTTAIIIIVISIVIKESMAQFAFWCSRRSGSDLIKADGWHHRSDALSSLAILIGIFLGKYFWWIDSVMGLVMSLLLFRIAFKIMKDSISKLLGEMPDDTLKKKIQELIEQTTDIDVQPHHFHCHTYGNHKELSFHIYLDPDLPLKNAHEIADKIEELIRQNLKMETTIHIEPRRIGS